MIIDGGLLEMTHAASLFSDLCTSDWFLAFGSLPCLAETCPCDVKSTSCIDLSVCRPSSRPRILLKAPTLAEMEEMNLYEASFRRASSSWGWV